MMYVCRRALGRIAAVAAAPQLAQAWEERALTWGGAGDVYMLGLRKLAAVVVA